MSSSMHNELPLSRDESSMHAIRRVLTAVPYKYDSYVTSQILSAANPNLTPCMQKAIIY
jgi:hypothetical protein